MEIVLKVDSPQKGARFIEHIGGKIVIFQIIDVVESLVDTQENTDFIKQLESAQKKLKGKVLKYDQPFESAVPESDWEVYRS